MRSQHILGHIQITTTQRYACLSQDTLLAAVNSATVAGSTQPIGLDGSCLGLQACQRLLAGLKADQLGLCFV